MKEIIFVITFFSCVVTLAQSKNELLMEAISKDDRTAALRLLQENADPNFVSRMTEEKTSPLIAAVKKRNRDVEMILLQYKANVNWKDQNNYTALMYAAERGNKEIVQLLIDYGADSSVQSGGASVLSLAKESGNPEVIYIIENNIRKRTGHNE